MTKITNLSPSQVLISQTAIPNNLAATGQLFSQTGQYVVSDKNQKILVYLPFGINGGPLYFDYLVFRSTGEGPFSYSGNVENIHHQGSSGHHYVTRDSDQSVIVADSGKEWIGANNESVWHNLGYDYLKEPPQDYTKFPLGYLVKITASNSKPYINQEIITNFRSYNHSVASGDFDGDGVIDYVASGQSTENVDSAFWSRIGYIVLGKSSGQTGDPIWITSPNLEGVGTKKFGMSNVTAFDLTGDGKDEIIFAGGAGNASTSDKVVVVYQYLNGQLSEYSHVTGYGKFLSNPGYNHYLIDFDKDGDQDLLSYFGVGRVGFELLENTGFGRFKAIAGNLGLDQLSLLDFKHIRIMDFDQDGYQDIVLDNLTPEWNLSSSPTNLAKAFIKNNNGTRFSFADPSAQAGGFSLGPSYQSIVTTFAGQISVDTFQFVTTYLKNNNTEFGAFTQNISFDFPKTKPLNNQPIVNSIMATEGRMFNWMPAKLLLENISKLDTVNFSSNNLPVWLTLDSSTGRISGQLNHASADANSYSINILVTGENNQSLTSTLTLNIKNISVIKGSAGSDQIVAGAGVDIIRGLAGNDSIIGGTGDDQINGGAGNDQLIGGDGSDRFIFDTRLDSLTNLDEIIDFVTGTDQIALRGSIFKKLRNDNNLSDNLWVNGLGEQDGNDYLVYQNETIFYDIDGNGAIEPLAFVKLINNPNINYLDIVIY